MKNDSKKGDSKSKGDKEDKEEKDMSQSITNAQIVTNVMIGSAMILGVFFSIVNMTSPVGIWSLVNQFQILILLLLTGAFIPKSIRQYLSGFEFLSLKFDFIPLNKIPLVSKLYVMMKFEQNKDELKDVGLDFESTIINNIVLLVILLLFILAHIPVVLLYT